MIALGRHGYSCGASVIKDVRSAPSLETIALTAAAYKFAFDESVGFKRHDYFAVAGVYATRSQWRSFYSQWRKALKEGGRIDYFKMSEAAGRRGQFEGWKVTDVKRKVELLTKVLRATTSGHTVSVIPLTPFKAIMGNSYLPKEYENPYLMSFMLCLQVAAKVMSSLPQPQTRPVLVFDDSDKFTKAVCNDFFHGMKDAQNLEGEALLASRWLGGLLWQEEKVQEPGIQAADLAAWHYRTLPWEKMHKPNRRRKFIGQIGDHPFLGHKASAGEMSLWRGALQRFVEERREEHGIPSLGLKSISFSPRASIHQNHKPSNRWRQGR